MLMKKNKCIFYKLTSNTIRPFALRTHMNSETKQTTFHLILRPMFLKTSFTSVCDLDDEKLFVLLTTNLATPIGRSSTTTTTKIVPLLKNKKKGKREISYSFIYFSLGFFPLLLSSLNPHLRQTCSKPNLQFVTCSYQYLIDGERVL